MADNNKENQKPEKQYNPYIRFSAVAFQMGATIYLGSKLGNWLDTTYNKTFFTPSITLFSVFVAIYLVIKEALKLSK